MMAVPDQTPPFRDPRFLNFVVRGHIEWEADEVIVELWVFRTNVTSYSGIVTSHSI